MNEQVKMGHKAFRADLTSFLFCVALLVLILYMFHMLMERDGIVMIFLSMA